MSSINIAGDSSGSISLTVPSVAGTNTATLPAATGVVMVSGAMPAFSATRGTSNQSISNATFTKVQLNNEEYDTANCFDSTTNYRFTPTVAGYYQINANISYIASSGLSQIYLAIYKNGIQYFVSYQTASYGAGGHIGKSTLIYFNGTTDYIELYGYSDTGTGTAFFASSQLQTFMNGSLVRAA